MKRRSVVPPACLAAFVLMAADGPPPTILGATLPQAVSAARPVPGHKTRAAGAVTQVARANRSALVEPKGAGFINAVQIFPYSDGAIYQVYTAPERVTDIALEPGEGLGAVASGDTVRWVIGDTTSGSGPDKRTHILVKPFAAGLATNLVVTTDRRTYHLALRSTAGTAMSAVKWTYPGDALLALKRSEDEAAAAAPIATGFDLEQLNFNYALSGDTPSWRPLRAFDNGRQTFIEFPVTLAVGEAPPLFIVRAKGEAELVNYRVRGRFYVVDRIFDAAELRLGTRRQDVVRIARTGEGLARSRRPRSGQ